MSPDEFQWEEKSLTDEDERLIRAYAHVGRPLDDLAYTEDFDKLLREAGIDEDDQERHRIFKRLLNLRKRGRLPRLPPRSIAG